MAQQGWQKEKGRNLPPNWSKIRAAVFKRDDNRCVWRNTYGERCETEAQECDHIGHRDDHSMENLRSLCRFHHAQRTAAQAHKAAAANRARIYGRFRRKESHPGLIDKASS